MGSLLTGASSIVQAADSTAQPAALRCEYQTSPLGIDIPRPHLSWRMDSDRRGERQTAYQILVASSPELLEKGKGDLWDSGRVGSDQSLQIEYAGKPLTSRERCYWKIRLWDKDRNPTPWSPSTTWTMGLLAPADWRAHWIESPTMPGPAGANAPAPSLPLFRRKFTVARPLRRAELYLCGLGQFELHIDGQKPDDALLEPGWTDYKKTCLYRAFDLTDKLSPGDHALGILLGSGMYDVHKDGRYAKFHGSFGPPKLIAQLHLDYADGTGETIISDSSWKTAPGPITLSNVYGGEDYDARLERSGWDRPDFTDTAWAAATLTESPGGKLVGALQSAPEIGVVRTLTPKQVTQIKPGVWVYDLGQNGSLIPRLTVSGPTGATIRITPGEKLKDDGTVGQTGGPTYFQYTLKGGAPETWSPRFCYYGSRYFQVEGATPAGQTGAPAQPIVTKIEGLFISSTAAPAGEFTCSNDLFNRTSQIIDAAMRSNMVSTLTDCPHREKLGWLEQDHLMGPSLMYCYEMPTLFRKIVGDMADAQNDNGFVPNIAPQYTTFGKSNPDYRAFDDSPEWGSAFVIVPWHLYRWYGDEAILRQHYDGMKRYVAYLGSQAKENIVSYGLGDWYDLGPKAPGYAQLTPVALTATAFYYHDLDILTQTAHLLGKDDEARTFAAQASAVKDAFNRKFYDAATRRYATGSQTAGSLPLAFGMVPDGDEARVLADVITDIRQHDNGLTAGDIGYRFLLRALADGGRSDVIFAMNSRSDRPGYGYMLAQGATTLTEAWNANTSSSLNHFMLGHIEEWFYSDLAGIQQAPDSVAFQKIVIHPSVVGDVSAANGSYLSPYGKIESHWKVENGTFHLDVTIPPNTTATIFLPTKNADAVTEGGKPASRSPGVKRLKDQTGTAFAVGAGAYSFAAPYTATE